MKDETADLRQTEQSETYTDDLYQSPVHPRVGRVFASSQWGLKAGNIGIGDETQEEDCYWL